MVLETKIAQPKVNGTGTASIEERLLCKRSSIEKLYGKSEMRRQTRGMFATYLLSLPLPRI